MHVSRETLDWTQLWESKLREFLTALSCRSEDGEIDNIVSFARLVLERNRLLHLVSQRQPERELVKQMVDSASALRCLELQPRCRLLDVGSGAGIPGLVIKLLRSDVDLISLDSSPKKIEFQKLTCTALRISAECVQADFRRATLEPKVDVVIVKALGLHREIIRRATNWLHPDGKLVFLEGRSTNPAIEAAVRKTKCFWPNVEIRKYPLVGFRGIRHLAILRKV